MLPPPTDGDDSLADAAVQVADELRVGLGQLPEGAVQERDVGAAARHGLALGVEPEPVHLAEQRLHARLGVRSGVPASAPHERPAAVASSASAPTRSASIASMPGEQRVAGRVEPEARARPARASTRAGAGRPCRGGRARRRRGRPRAGARGAAARCWRGGPARSASSVAVSGRGRARELLIHGETRLVAECFQDRQQVHFLDGTLQSGIFSRSSLVLFGT